MKKLFVLMLALIVSMSIFIVASAEEYTTGLYLYILDNNNNATITAYTGHETSLSIPAKLDGYYVTGIGDIAFFDCDSLQSVTLPDTVYDIGDWAFGDCSLLTSIKLSNELSEIGWGAFYNCESLNSISLPNSLQYLDSYAFTGCAFDTILLPASLHSIGIQPFFTCSLLTSIQVKAGNPIFTSKDGVLFNKEETILVAYPTGKTDRTYSIPEGYTSIAASAFYNNDYLASIHLPNSLVVIDEDAFTMCSSLTSISLPKNLQYIGEGAFTACSSLSSFSVIQGNPFFAVDSGALYNTQDMTLVAYPAARAATECIVPPGIQTIGGYAFYGSSLHSVSLPESIEAIGDGAFHYCTSLSSINLPDNLQLIGAAAFYGCSALTSITIPNHLLYIKDWAFNSCSSLTSVTLPGSLEFIGEEVFEGCEKLTLYVPRDSYAHYYAEENGIPYQFTNGMSSSQEEFTEESSAEHLSYSQNDFTAALQQSGWQYARSETRSDAVEGPYRMTNADYADDNIITLKFQKDGNMIASYSPRTGGDPVVFEYPYNLDSNSRALIQNEDFEFNGTSYASFVEYTLNSDGELAARMIMVDKATYRNDYFGITTIYIPVTLN